jgi:hypothetical protein
MRGWTQGLIVFGAVSEEYLASWELLDEFDAETRAVR